MSETKRPYRIKDPVAFSESRWGGGRKTPSKPGYDPTERPSPYPNTDVRRAYMRKYMANRRESKTEEISHAR
jgi:hypothetical protein